jgi:hypothetical protein
MGRRGQTPEVARNAHHEMRMMRTLVEEEQAWLIYYMCYQSLLYARMKGRTSINTTGADTDLADSTAH